MVCCQKNFDATLADKFEEFLRMGSESEMLNLVIVNKIGMLMQSNDKIDFFGNIWGNLEWKCILYFF